jgi:peptidoglycan/LPS O-acetylase OafA/YrhL
MMTRHRLEWLDLFRGIAALVVVLFHFSWALHLPVMKFAPRAVELFFVLSGIVLGRRYDTEIRGGLPLIDFAWARLRRLYPMVLIATVLVAGLSIMGVPDTAWSRASWGTTLGMLFVVPYSPEFGSGQMFPGDGPMWSLWAELAANLVWFFALRAGRGATRALFAAAMVGYLVLTIHLRWRADESGWLCMVAALVRALAWFGVGYAISMRRPAASGPIWVAFLALLAACACVQRAWVPSSIGDLLVITTGTWLMVNLMHTAPTSVALRRACAWMGILSYPIYLIHFPASRVAAWVASHRVDQTLAYGGTILLIGVAAACLNEWLVKRIPEPRRVRPLAQNVIAS